LGLSRALWNDQAISDELQTAFHAAVGQLIRGPVDVAPAKNRVSAVKNFCRFRFKAETNNWDEGCFGLEFARLRLANEFDFDQKPDKQFIFLRWTDFRFGDELARDMDLGKVADHKKGVFQFFAARAVGITESDQADRRGRMSSSARI
jgi:hypothetical protein